MARGVRSNATLLPTFSPNLQPQSLSSYDPLTRRNTILVANIVPTLKFGTGVELSVPSDRYYVNLGAALSNSNLPAWLSSTGNATFGQWDASAKQPYMRLSNAAGAFFGNASVPCFIYPTGPFGTASSFAPKNASAVAALINFTARFNANADYDTCGVGANNGAASEFSTAGNRFIQVLRNAGSWELGTSDGTTISQSSGGTADGSFHEFRVRWSLTDLTLYVDDVLTVTKTTNMPDRPLFAMGCAPDATNTIDIVDYLIEWEAT